MENLGIELIARERREQIEKHGRSIESDAKNNAEYQLVEAASVLSMDVPKDFFNDYIKYHEEYPPNGWRGEIWSKMLRKSYKERLIIAGALLAAEYDRFSATEAADNIISIIKG